MPQWGPFILRNTSSVPVSVFAALYVKMSSAMSERLL